MIKFTPFFINTNICFDKNDASTYEKFLYNVANNTGNSYIAYSVIKMLYGNFRKVDDIRNLWLDINQLTSEKAKYINENFSHAILTLQDQIRVRDSYLTRIPYKEINKFLEQIKIPFVVFSLGANSSGGYNKDLHKKLDKEFVRFLNILSNNTVSLGVRGNYTAEVLDKLGIKNVEPVGCPTFYEMGRNRIIKKKKLPEDFKVLATGGFTSQETDRLYYALQDEKWILKLLYFQKNIDLPEVKSLFNMRGDYPPQMLKALLENRVGVFSNMDRWKDYASKCNFSIGSRVHGSIIALNIGIPAILTNGDSRAAEMAELFDIPLNTKLGFNDDLQTIYQKADFSKMNKNYNTIYDNFEKWLGKNGLNIVKPSSTILIKEEFLKKNKVIKLFDNPDYSNLSKFEIDRLDNFIKKFYYLKQTLLNNKTFTKKESELSEEIRCILNSKKISKFRMLIYGIRYLFWKKIVINLLMFTNIYFHSKKIDKMVERLNYKTIKLGVKSGSLK